MKVFYRPEQTAHITTYYSPSMYKPELVVADWAQRFQPEIHAFEPVGRAHLYAVHDREYVDGVLDLKGQNGFGGYDPEIATSLPYTSGSMVAAALCAYREGGITCSPTSGFHHARFGSGGGYCTFNGLMVAAMALFREGATRVGIVDLDMHYGDGTQDIIETLDIGDRVDHYTLGGVRRRRGGGENALLRDLSEQLERMLPSTDIVLYQAGADSHIDDPLGGVFTTTGYRERDRLVFSAARRAGVPVAWNLAGGYQDPVSEVIALHRITFEEAVRAESAGLLHPAYELRKGVV